MFELSPESQVINQDYRSPAQLAFGCTTKQHLLTYLWTKSRIMNFTYFNCLNRVHGEDECDNMNRRHQNIDVHKEDGSLI